MTPPDSGEREAHVPTERGMCLHTTSGRHQPTAVCSACGISLASLVGLPLPLAQRILAALEREIRNGTRSEPELHAIRAELRAIVERKP